MKAINTDDSIGYKEESESTALDMVFVIAATLLDMEPDEFVVEVCSGITREQALHARDQLCSVMYADKPRLVRLMKREESNDE